MGATRPPVDYLAKCSKSSLESLELSRLSVAANLRKQFHQILNELIENEVDARLARTILEWRRTQHSLEGDVPPAVLPFEESGAAGLLPASAQLSIVFETSAPTVFEAENTRRIASDPPTARDTASASLDVDLPQPHRLHLSYSPLLAQAAASGGACVEPLGERLSSGRRVERRDVARRVAPRAPLVPLREANSVREGGVEEPFRPASHEHASRMIGFVPVHVARTLICAAVVVAKQLT